MWLLGVDTSGLTQSVVLLHSDGCCVTRSTSERRGQGEVVHGLVNDCLGEADIALKDIAGIAVVTGPGSFTGLRIGLALAQGLARSLGCKLAGYDRFTLLRAAAPDAVIVLDSLRAELFVQFSSEVTEMLTTEAIQPRLAGRRVAGDGVPQLQAQPVAVVPEAELAARRLLADILAGADLPPALPVYVRLPDVTFPQAAS